MGLREALLGGPKQKETTKNGSIPPSKILEAFGGELVAAASSEFDKVLDELGDDRYTFVGDRVLDVPVLGDTDELVRNIKTVRARGGSIQVNQLSGKNGDNIVNGEIVTPHGTDTVRVYPVDVSITSGIELGRGFFRNPFRK